MKFFYYTKIMLWLVTFSFLISSCKETDITKPCEEPFCGCPPPQMGIDGVKFPSKYYSKPQTSFSQNKVAFFEVGVLLNIWDKNSNSILQINTISLIPPPAEIYKIINCSWCPYDDNKIAILCWILTDTSSTNEKKNVLGKKLYLYEIALKKITDISPALFGLYGFPNDPINPALNFIIWLPNSSPEIDLFYFPGYALYNLQSGTIDSNYFKENIFYSISNNNKYRIRRILDDIGNVNTIEINGNKYSFSDKFMNIGYISISPNSEKILLCVSPKDTAKLAENIRWKEIWIFNIKDIVENNPYKNLKIINLRRDFCKYAFIGLNAEFLTNNSLVVSMNSDGDDIAPLFEISLDGKIIRQITDK